MGYPHELQKLLQDEHFVKALTLFLTVKLALIVIASASHVLLPLEMTHRQARAESLLINPWAQYDAAAYVDIAQRGYNSQFMDGTGNYAWYPFYPLLIRLFSFLGYYTAAFLIANAASVAAIALLYVLAKEELGGQKAYRTIFFLSMFPAAYFFTAMYTESVFLALSLGAFIAAQRNMFLHAGVLGFLLSLTRMQGVLIFFPLAYMYLRTIDFNYRRIGKEALFLFLIPFGLLLLLGYHHELTGDPFAQFKTQASEDFHRRISLPWESVLFETRAMANALGWGVQHAFVHFLNISTLALLIFFAYVSYRHLKPEYTIYILTSILLPTMSSTLEAITRFALVIFPVFMAMAVYESKNARAARYLKALYMVFAVLLVLFTIRHANEEILFDMRELLALAS
ncbi:MAG: hypothetical protein HYY37_01770 [Candidatus Aenigmarchaeota archaeon]|nr:hypothetical protein [Candidatus Aenigmarchaeota archaeon]